jgi:hypothetical protein
MIEEAAYAALLGFVADHTPNDAQLMRREVVKDDKYLDHKWFSHFIADEFAYPGIEIRRHVPVHCCQDGRNGDGFVNLVLSGAEFVACIQLKVVPKSRLWPPANASTIPDFAPAANWEQLQHYHVLILKHYDNQPSVWTIDTTVDMVVTAAQEQAYTYASRVSAEERFRGRCNIVVADKRVSYACICLISSHVVSSPLIGLAVPN